MLYMYYVHKQGVNLKIDLYLLVHSACFLTGKLANERKGSNASSLVLNLLSEEADKGLQKASFANVVVHYC